VNRRLRCQSYACPLDPINFHPIILVDFDAYALPRTPYPASALRGVSVCGFAGYHWVTSGSEGER